MTKDVISNESLQDTEQKLKKNLVGKSEKEEKEKIYQLKVKNQLKKYRSNEK